MRTAILLFILVAASPLAAKKPPIEPITEVKVDLRNPTYQNGILYTNQGGVIQSPDLRIQAKTIQYIKREEEGHLIHRIEAEGDLMIQYKGRVYVGKELEFDFVKRSGIVYEGKTFANMWYVGGDKIELNPDGSYNATNATITTCENVDSAWDFHAGKIDMLKNDKLEAKKVRFRLFRIPFLWLPSFKINLKKFKEPVFRYSIRWDKGPRAMARYQIYSWQDFALYGRLQYRWGKGWGGAIETEYAPEGQNTTFYTRSYLAKDRLDNATNPIRRYRVQGAYNTVTQSEKTRVNLSWDKYSDVRMPDDFKSEDFEVNPAKITQFFVWHQTDDLISSFKVRPRLNPFESIKQDLPSLFSTLRPIELWNTGIISTNWIKLSYMDFAYSDQLAPTPGNDPLSDFRSARLDFRPKLYRTIHLGPTLLTPYLGAIGIFYSNSQNHNSKSLGLLSYGVRLQARGHQNYSHYKHVIEPYIEYSGLSRPTVNPDHHYIFTIQDGFQRINQIQFGLRQFLSSKKRLCKEPSFTADLYANAFFSDPTIPEFVYKLYCNLSWRLPSVHLDFRNSWNFRNQVWDHSNLRLRWTVNENVALTFETRYRSRYDWRKADHENFILDVTRSESELLDSPLSDRRITLLSKLFIRFTPFWECQFTSHHGFYRLTQKPYNEFNVDLFTWVSSSWKLRLSYRYTEKDPRNHFDLGLDLVKK
ncbi:MAG: LPS-assembly protein LptD [Verrucomicrobia bacterium]|nr:LPS-assembly protein LptD [Verrucomicrobiota bacterium]